MTGGAAKAASPLLRKGRIVRKTDRVRESLEATKDKLEETDVRLAKLKSMGGRPRESADGELRKLRSIRFSDSEWARLHAMAEAAEMSVSDLIRTKVLEG